MQHLCSPLIESWLLSASEWSETFIVAQLLYSLFFLRFMLYTVCKTLRLSVFNKELFDLIWFWKHDDISATDSYVIAYANI